MKKSCLTCKWLSKKSNEYYCDIHNSFENRIMRLIQNAYKYKCSFWEKSTLKTKFLRWFSNLWWREIR